jgi:glycosyltransferase involved in cell wall biosynthesis
MLESERPLIQTEYLRRYNHASVIVAQNTKLRDMAREKGLDHVLNLTIGNGINTEEFTPARDYPEEFTVGASGNFSLEAFDEWKGFGRYIVPACKLAKVKLRWCSWKGQAFSMPKTVGEQVPLNMMNKWYHGLSCLVSMSKSEGCSGVVFEAMASGLPVISTKVGWHGDKCTDQILWAERPQEQTPYTDKVTIEELTHRILWLKNHPAAARAVGARARKFSEGWPHSRVADQWRRVFSTLRV